MVNEQDIPHETMNAQTPPASAQQGDTVRKSVDYWGYIVLAAGVGALLWGLVSAVGTGRGYWEYTSGLKGVAGAFLLGLVAILIGAVQGWRTRKAINRPPRDGHMAFVRSPDLISIELLQDGHLPAQEPWASMPNTGVW